MKRLFTVLSILLLVGCTITKRHFGPGYHVEWKKSVSKTGNEIDHLDVTDTRKELSVVSEENEVISEEVIPADSLNNNESIYPDNSEILIEEPTKIFEVSVKWENEPFVEYNHISNDEDAVDEPKRKVELFTWISLGGLVLAIIFIIMIFTISMEFLFFFAAVHYFTFAISSMISVAQIRKNPSKYKGKGLTWTLFGLSLATIVATIAFMIYKIVELFT